MTMRLGSNSQKQGQVITSLPGAPPNDESPHIHHPLVTRPGDPPFKRNRTTSDKPQLEDQSSSTNSSSSSSYRPRYPYPIQDATVTTDFVDAVITVNNDPNDRPRHARTQSHQVLPVHFSTTNNTSNHGARHVRNHSHHSVPLHPSTWAPSLVVSQPESSVPLPPPRIDPLTRPTGLAHSTSSASSSASSSPSSTCSSRKSQASAAVDAMLDARLQRMLDAPDPVPPSSLVVIGPLDENDHNDEAPPSGASVDHPVDLTWYRGPPEEEEEDVPGVVNDEMDTQHEFPLPLNQYHLQQDEMDDGVKIAANEVQKTRHFQNYEHHHHDDGAPGPMDPPGSSPLGQAPPPPNMDDNDDEEELHYARLETVPGRANPSLVGSSDRPSKRVDSRTLHSRPASIHKRPRSSSLSSTQHHRALTSPPTPPPTHSLHHPYSRPGLLRTPQRSVEMWKAHESPVESPRTQRSSSFFNPWAQPSSMAKTGLSSGVHMFTANRHDGPKSIYQQTWEHRQRRRQSLGGMDDFGGSGQGGVFTMGLFANQNHHITSTNDLHDDEEDASSVDSETMLELWASKIRAELRHEALIEMALEAERAAESGQESFSLSRPWAYRENESENEEEKETDSKFEIPHHIRRRRPPHAVRAESSMAAISQSQELPPHSVLRRNASYTEGITPHPVPRLSVLSTSAQYSFVTGRTGSLTMTLGRKRQLRPPKIPIQELRNVDEVFPDLDNLHKNLRTHLARNTCREDCLFFDEQTEEVLTPVDDKGGPSAVKSSGEQDELSPLAAITTHRTKKTRNGEKDREATAANKKPHERSFSINTANSSSSFLESFSFDLLGSAAAAGVSIIQCPSNMTKSEDEGDIFDSNDVGSGDGDNSTGGIGDLLANHIASSKLKPPPKREMLPGLEEAVEQLQQLVVAVGKLQPSAAAASAGDTAAKASSSSLLTNSPQRSSHANKLERQDSHEHFVIKTPTQQTRGQPTKENDARPVPRALFDDEDNPSNSYHHTNDSSILTADDSPGIIQTPMPPSDQRNGINADETKSSGDFVTPAKLRRIRNRESRRDRVSQPVSIPMPLLTSTPTDRQNGGGVTKTATGDHHVSSNKLTRRYSSNYANSSSAAATATTVTLTPSSPSSDNTPPELLLPTLPTIAASAETSPKSLNTATSPRSTTFLRPSLSSTHRRHRQQHLDDKNNDNEDMLEIPSGRSSPGSAMLVLSAATGCELDSLQEMNKEDQDTEHQGLTAPHESSPDNDIGPVVACESNDDVVAETNLSSENCDDIDENGSHRENEELPNKCVSTPKMNDCSCLSLSPTASLEDLGLTSAENPLIVIAPEDESMSSCSSNTGDRPQSPEPFATAMKMLSHLSPRRTDKDAANAAASKAERRRRQHRERRRRRALYVGLQENEDFMKNFLYCGKKRVPPMDSFGTAGIGPDGKECVGEPCHDDRFCETNLVASMANQCYVAFVLDPDDNESSTPLKKNEDRGATNSSSALTPSVGIPTTSATVATRDSLFGTTHTPHKVEPETWFDVATEKVDTVIERLVGSTPQNDWNLSFEPPSLRKIECPSASAKALSMTRTTTSSRKTPQDPYDRHYHHHHAIHARQRWTGGQLDTTLEEETNYSGSRLLTASSSMSPTSTHSNNTLPAGSMAPAQGAVSKTARVENKHEEEKKEPPIPLLQHQESTRMSHHHSGYGSIAVGHRGDKSMDPPIISLLSSVHDDALNDDQFQLIYGMTREDHSRRQEAVKHTRHLRTRSLGTLTTTQSFHDRLFHHQAGSMKSKIPNRNDGQHPLVIPTNHHHKDNQVLPHHHHQLPSAHPLYHQEDSSPPRRSLYQRRSQLLERRNSRFVNLRLRQSALGPRTTSLSPPPHGHGTHMHSDEEQMDEMMLLALNKSY